MSVGRAESKRGRSGYWVMLLSVVVLWGIDPIVNRLFYGYYSAAVLSVIYTFVSAAVFAVLAAGKLRKLDARYLKVALPIGVCNSLACLLQRIGLQYTTPSSYAFLEHLSVVAVPIFVFIFIRKKPSGPQVLSAALCLVGCFVLSGIDPLGTGGSFGVGELLCSLAGLLLGGCVAATGIYAKGLDLSLFMAIHMLCYFLMSLFMAIGLDLITVGGVPLEAAVFTAEPLLLIGAVLFGLLSVGIAWLLRTEALRHISETAVAVISPLSAVITALFSVLLSMESFTWRLAVAAPLILAGAIISSLDDLKEK